MRAGDVPGQRIIAAAWTSTVAFAVTALGDLAGIDAFEFPATVVAISFFFLGVVVWAAAFVRAVSRSRYEEITLTGLFFLQGSAPRPAQVQLLGALGVSIAVAAVTAGEAPFGVMEPVLPLALAGWWGARYGTFPPRRTHEREGSS